MPYASCILVSSAIWCLKSGKLRMESENRPSAELRHRVKVRISMVGRVHFIEAVIKQSVNSPWCNECKKGVSRRTLFLVCGGSGGLFGCWFSVFVYFVCLRLGEPWFKYKWGQLR